MRNFMLIALIARPWRLRSRWGVTATGLALGSGRGTFPTVCLVGFWALARREVPGPSGPTAVSLMLIGAAAGVVYGLIPRHPRLGRLRRPTIKRVALCCTAGCVAAPALFAFGHLPADMANQVGSIVLLGGLLGMVGYVVARRLESSSPPTCRRERAVPSREPRSWRRWWSGRVPG